jgi:hypothetical protein
MILYSKAARRWIEPLLALGVGGRVTLRFLAPPAGPEAELGMLAPDEESYRDYPAPASYVRELTTEELQTQAGQFRQGAREVLLGAEFLANVAVAEGHETVPETLEAAAGALIGGQICRIRSFKPLDAGDETYAWQLFCDAPLEAAGWLGSRLP